MARTRYASDRGLIARMGATMFLLGLVFTGFIIALYFVFFWYGHRHGGGGGSSAGLVVLAAVIGAGVAFGGYYWSDKIALRRLRRLRFGSHGAAVKALQQQLNLPNPDGDFGPNTCSELHKLQKNLPGSTGSDGILTPELHDAQGWQFLASIGV